MLFSIQYIIGQYDDDDDDNVDFILNYNVKTNVLLEIDKTPNCKMLYSSSLVK